MPLIQAPLATLRAFERGLLDLTAPNDPGLKLLKDIRQGHQIYTLGIQDILTSPGLGGAVLAGWQFSGSNDVLAAAATISAAVGSQTPRIISVSRGTEVGLAIEAINQAMQQSIFNEVGTELVVLRIPGILMEAVWLKTPQPGQDKVAPYLTLSEGVQVGQWYSPEEFIAALKPVAMEFLAAGTATLSDVRQ